MKLILDAAHLDMWETQNLENISEDHVLKSVLDAEMKRYHEKLKVDIQTMSRLSVYREIKESSEMEPYVRIVKDRKQRGLLAKARMGTLPIREETGRYRGTPRQDRVCLHCDRQQVEDVAHVMLHCEKYADLRTVFYEKVFNDVTVIINMRDEQLLQLTLATTDSKIMFATANFLQSLLHMRGRAS